MNERFVMTVDSIDQLKTAVCYDIEAVVALKGRSMSAHTPFELAEVMKQEKVSVLMNRMFFEHELEDVKRDLEILSDARILHIYFADPAVLFLCKEEMRKKLIYRPETLLTDSLDARYWMSLGISSVSISPLITEEEVRTITSCVEGCELSVYGRAVMSISCRQLLSAWTQAYGLPCLQGKEGLELQEEKRAERMPIYEDAYGTIIYTDFVQESFETICGFAQAGAKRFYVDSLGLPFSTATDAILAMRRILSGEDGKTVKREFVNSHEGVPFSTGYYGQKTIQ